MSDRRNAIRLVLGGRVEVLAGMDPTMTTLEYLRRHAGRTGAKEGCGEGGCGACTVAIGELEGDRVVYRAVNACLTPIVALDGRELLTVEDLAAGDALHPVQRAFVEGHASQCGFCTPGFVMSVFASRPGPRTSDIERALSGNLCRCTGYRAIKEASRRALDSPDPIRRRRPTSVHLLRSIRRRGGLELRAGAGRLLVPATLPELCRVMQRNPRARLLGGGTDIYFERARDASLPPTLIDVARVPELQRIRERAGRLEVGAAVTLDRLERALAGVSPAMAGVFSQVGTVQVRNLATIGGNFAGSSRIADAATVAAALDSTLHLRGPRGARTVAAEDYLATARSRRLRRGEFIERLVLSVGGRARTFRFYKVGRRQDHDQGVVSAALWLEMHRGRVRDVRLVFAGVAEVTRRARRAEASLRDGRLRVEEVSAATQQLESDLRPRGNRGVSADERLQLARALLARFVREAGARA